MNKYDSSRRPHAVRRGMCAAAMLAVVGAASAQQEAFPMMDKVADRVIAHYQNSSCQQIMAKKATPPSQQQMQMEQRAVQLLRTDPTMRQQFINKVSAPIANKMFECGMIP
jgi:hypothetical protein